MEPTAGAVPLGEDAEASSAAAAAGREGSLTLPEAAPTVHAVALGEDPQDPAATGRVGSLTVS